MKRREFVKYTAASGAILLLPPALLRGQSGASNSADIDLKKLTEEALNTSRASGASYADVRINRYPNQSISTREQRVMNISNNESSGFGVRVLVEGTWGFAASNTVSKDEVSRIAKEAVA